MSSIAARLLVVDDNPENRDLLVRRLAARGYEVEKASDGFEALRKVREKEYDLVVLDVMMPGLSGLDVLRSIREKWSVAELPVVMATARGGSDEMVEALALGANDYVVKPFSPMELVARLKRLLWR